MNKPQNIRQATAMAVVLQTNVEILAQALQPFNPAASGNLRQAAKLIQKAGRAISPESKAQEEVKLGEMHVEHHVTPDEVKTKTTYGQIKAKHARLAVAIRFGMSGAPWAFTQGQTVGDLLTQPALVRLFDWSPSAVAYCEGQYLDPSTPLVDGATILVEDPPPGWSPVNTQASRMGGTGADQ